MWASVITTLFICCPSIYLYIPHPTLSLSVCPSPARCLWHSVPPPPALYHTLSLSLTPSSSLLVSISLSQTLSPPLSHLLSLHLSASRHLCSSLSKTDFFGSERFKTRKINKFIFILSLSNQTCQCAEDLVRQILFSSGEQNWILTGNGAICLLII